MREAPQLTISINVSCTVQFKHPVYGCALNIKGVVVRYPLEDD